MLYYLQSAFGIRRCLTLFFLPYHRKTHEFYWFFLTLHWLPLPTCPRKETETMVGKRQGASISMARWIYCENTTNIETWIGLVVGGRLLPWHNRLNKYAFQAPEKTPRTRNLALRSPRTHSIHRGQEKYNRWQMVVYRICWTYVQNVMVWLDWGDWNRLWTPSMRLRSLIAGTGDCN